MSQTHSITATHGFGNYLFPHLKAENAFFPKIFCVFMLTEKVVINRVDKIEAATWQHFNFNLVQVKNYYIVGS